jgi:hypothetical protein
MTSIYISIINRLFFFFKIMTFEPIIIFIKITILTLFLLLYTYKTHRIPIVSDRRWIRFRLHRWFFSICSSSLQTLDVRGRSILLTMGICSSSVGIGFLIFVRLGWNIARNCSRAVRRFEYCRPWTVSIVRRRRSLVRWVKIGVVGQIKSGNSSSGYEWRNFSYIMQSK